MQIDLNHLRLWGGGALESFLKEEKVKNKGKAETSWRDETPRESPVAHLETWKDIRIPTNHVVSLDNQQDNFSTHIS